MNQLPEALFPSVFRTQTQSRGQKKRGHQGSGIRGLTPRDNILNALKAATQHYGMHSDAENSAKLVIGMVGIENMNIEYLAAALYLYNTYQEVIPKSSTNKASKITPKMFEDETSSMKRIRLRLESISRSGVPKKDVWPDRKANILTYFYAIMVHLSGPHVDFKPSEAYKRQVKKEEEEEDDVDADALEEVDDDADETANPADADDDLVSFEF